MRFGKVRGNFAEGLVLPNMTSAMALPVSLPPYQACKRAGVVDKNGRAIGVPDWITTTVLGLMGVRVEINLFRCNGRPNISRSAPSPSQSD